jgi:hypothetical protein
MATSPAMAQFPTASLTSDVTSISVGQSITFSLVMTLPVIPGQGFAGGGAVFDSGDGQHQLIGLGDTGAGPITFTYLNAGTYTADVFYTPFFHDVICFFPDECVGQPNGRPLGTFAALETVSVLVPEPATWAMMLIGFAGLGFAFRHSARERRTIAFDAAI